MMRQMFSRALRSILTALAVVGLVACSGARPPETGPPDAVYEWAMDRYEAGEYGAAVSGFRAFTTRNPVHPKADSAQFLMAEAMLEQGQPLQAGQEFRQMALTRPGSPLADEAQFGACRAYWEASPDIHHGQSETQTAVEECGRLSEFFPESDLVPRAEEIIEKAREKLARKQYRIARHYFDDDFYESANIYLEIVLQQYPEASIVPEVLATYYRSLKALGFDAEARQVRERLRNEFPDSEAARRIGGSDSANARDGERGR